MAAGIGLVAQGVLALRAAPSFGPTLLHVLILAIGLLLLVGLWTPIAGTMLAILALLHASLHLDNPWTCVLMGILGAALALLGPGGWSIDARLFGWKRIRIPDRYTCLLLLILSTVLLRPEGSPSALQFKEISRTEIVIAVTRSGVVRNKGSVQSALSVEYLRSLTCQSHQTVFLPCPSHSILATRTVLWRPEAALRTAHY